MLSRQIIYICIVPIMNGIASFSAYANNATLSINGNQRCIQSNGLPDHSTGQFPNDGNPNRISTQNILYCFDASPVKREYARPQHGSIGVALNGVTIRPGTADYWDDSSQRGHSRNRQSGWNLEGLGSRDLLGMDHNNAHVDNRGLYHYHGVADALVKSTAKDGSLIGYAADGFEIHYIPSQQASYRLKSGIRPSGPGGRYDGSYNQDWEYIAGSGTLDQCNGGKLNGQFVYFATESYPFFPRCLWGNASDDFGMQRNSLGNERELQHDPRLGANQPSHHSTFHRKNRQERHPPKEALLACHRKTSGHSCSFNINNHSLVGSCRITPQKELACVPNRPH